MALDGGSRLFTTGVLAVALFGVGGAARADTWHAAGGTCAINIASNPQVFAYTDGPSGTHGIYSISANGSFASWSSYQNIVPDGSVRLTPMGCATDGNQALVVYRDGSSTLRSRDRLSGWQETALPGGFSSFGQGLFMTLVSDAGKNKFVLFAVQNNNTITMSVWDDTTNPKWSTAVTLAAVPGGIGITNADDLTGYSFDIGNNPPSQGIVSVYVVANNGHLMENTGPLIGARTWIDHQFPPGTTGLSNIIGFGPSATAGRSSPFNHPGMYFDTDYDRRIAVPSADQSGVYANVALGGQSSFTWSKIAGSTTTPNIGFDLASALGPGCFQVGEPCAPSAVTTVDYFNNGSVHFADYYWGTTDGGPSLAGWTVESNATSAYQGPMAYVPTRWSTYGIIFYQTSTTNLAAVNIDNDAVVNLGHP